MKRKSKQPVQPPQPLTFGPDQRLQAVLQVPGSQKIYEELIEGSKQSAFLLEQATLGLLAKYEIPNDILQIKGMGYEVIINSIPKPDGSFVREIQLLKVLEKIEVPA